ncbi:MAG TPA: class I SAM-dependent methyltransferase [candidate division Zixibacteria bacterium]|nr:class I SAM-dependent methyltransferase [candidate division Zixibacteria bacterium]
MNEEKDWHEQDEFWELYEEVFFNPDRVEAATDEAAKIIALTEVLPGARVLDLCCGIGRHSIEFARRGFKVTAVDRTKRYLERAHRSADEAGVDIEFIESDMREFVRPNEFDLVLNMFTSFGYFEDATDDTQVAGQIMASLKPGGALILDSMGKEILARIFQPRSWERIGNTTVIEERWVTQNWGWIENRWMLIRDDKIYHHAISHRLYAASEYIRLFKDAGASEAVCYGNLDGESYDHKARRLVLLARK